MLKLLFGSSCGAHWGHLCVLCNVMLSCVNQLWSPVEGMHSRPLAEWWWVRVCLLMRLSALYYQGRQGLVEMCIRNQQRDLSIGWLPSLVPYFYSACISSIVSVSVSILLYIWLNKSGSAQVMPTLRLEGHARHINRRSDSWNGILYYVALCHLPIFTEIATSHRLKLTLVTLMSARKLISEYICKNNPRQISAPSQALTLSVEAASQAPWGPQIL